MRGLRTHAMRGFRGGAAEPVCADLYSMADGRDGDALRVDAPPRAHTPPSRPLSTFRRLGSGMDRACPRQRDGTLRSLACVKIAFCKRTCPTRPANSCDAVGMIDTFSPGLAMQMAKLRTQRSGIVVATLERDNAVKHAFSPY